MAEYVRKVVLLGDPMVGKTSLVQRFVKDMFDERYLSTIGAKPSKKVVKCGGHTVSLMIWDLAGHSYGLRSGFYAGAKGALLVCDITRRDTLNSLNSWYSALAKEVGDVPAIALVNKSDMDEREFGLDEAGVQGFPTLLTSAKTGANVNEAFTQLTEAVIRARR
ncbi:MAG: Rab family GTPase [Methanobacteriota archaeon]